MNFNESGNFTMSIYDDLLISRMLLVDDDQWIRHSLSLYMKCIGQKIDVAETAEEALEMIDGGGNYDLIIVDYKLPGMDGLEFLKRIKNREALKLFISAYAEPEVFSAALSAGANDALEKPINIEKLEEALADLA